MTPRLIPSERLRRLLEERVPPRILDVRSRAEYEAFHLPQAIHIPLAELESRAGELDPLVDLIVVSEHGIRSLKACQWLLQHGYVKAGSLLGGMAEFRFPQ